VSQPEFDAWVASQQPKPAAATPAAAPAAVASAALPSPVATH